MATAATTAATTAAARLERRRQQCRRSQRRYRDKQGSEEYNLVLDVNGLRERVEHLRSARDVLRSRLWSSRQALEGAAVKAARQYYLVFARGLHDPESGGTWVRRAYELQRGFARAFFDEDVTFGDGVGVDAVIEQWRRYSQFHATLRIQVVDTQVVGPAEAPIVVVRGRLVVRLSRETIENVFPHVLLNEPLVQALIGQRVEYPTSTAYAFNERVQVVRQELSVDFLTGLNALLHDAMAASRLVQRARIVDSCRFDKVADDSVNVQDVAVAGADSARENVGSSAGTLVEDVDVEPTRDVDDAGEEKRQEKRPDRLHLSYIMS